MKVGLVFDSIYLKHDTGTHVENRGRLDAIVEGLQKSSIMQKLVPIAPRPATRDELLRVHSDYHIDSVQHMAMSGGGWLDGDTYASINSYDAALYAAGGVISAIDAIMRGDVDSAFALVRPPGHHATSQRPMGFCLFNNIAIATRYAIDHYNLKRVLIIDFDVHHGNGTEEIFYRDPAVFYFSTHQYPFYPGTGASDSKGIGEAEGTTLNIPMPAGADDATYLRVFEKIFIPAADEFKPELILVSAGYDAHWADPLAAMEVTDDGFGRIAALIKMLAAKHCQNRLLFCLEGGYDPKALSQSVSATFEVLLQDDAVS